MKRRSFTFHFPFLRCRFILAVVFAAVFLFFLWRRAFELWSDVPGVDFVGLVEICVEAFLQAREKKLDFRIIYGLTPESGCASRSVCLFLSAIDFSNYDKYLKEMWQLVHDSDKHEFQCRTLPGFLLTLLTAILYIFKKGASIASRNSDGRASDRSPVAGYSSFRGL